jgi:hypothetical protein
MNQVNVEVNKVLSYYGFPDIKYINVSLIAVKNVIQHSVEVPNGIRHAVGLR